MPVILSERSESKDLRTDLTLLVNKPRRFFVGFRFLRMTAIFILLISFKEYYGKDFCNESGYYQLQI